MTSRSISATPCLLFFFASDIRIMTQQPGVSYMLHYLFSIPSSLGGRFGAAVAAFALSKDGRFLSRVAWITACKYSFFSCTVVVGYVFCYPVLCWEKLRRRSRNSIRKEMMQNFAQCRIQIVCSI